MKTHRPLFTAALIVTWLFWLSGSVQAKIPEPDHILYGILPDGQNVIAARINDEFIKSYTRGEISTAGDYFILRMPMDFLNPQEPGTARPGNAVSLFLDAETVAAITLTVGEKGTVQRVVLSTANDDGDDLLNGVDNCPDIANNDQDDADTDGQGDACDDNSDSDRDGYTDMQEYSNFLAGILDPEGQPFDPLVKNVSGGDNYIDPQSRLTGLIKVLQILTGSTIDCSECVIDIGNDKVLGLEEALELLQSNAGL